MRLLGIFIVFVAALSALAACKKDTSPTTERFRILEDKEEVIVGTDQVRISGVFEYPGNVESFVLRMGEEEHFHDAVDYAATLDGNSYAVLVTDLQPGTSYYYRYVVDYGSPKHYFSEIDSLTTLSDHPEVRTLEVLQVDSTTVRVGGELISDGGAAITERGVCWNTHGGPTVDDQRQAYVGSGQRIYYCMLSDMPVATTVYFRAYAINDCGVGYGEVMELYTGGHASTPMVTTVGVDSVTMTSARCLCNLVSTGGLPLTEQGACWSTSPEPDLQGSHVALEGGSAGEYQAMMWGLTPDTRYYVRAYAVNAMGTSYGETLEFLTDDGLDSHFEVNTLEVTDITATSAVVRGSVEDDTGEAVLERGICFSEAPYPSISNTCYACGAGIGDMEVLIDGLYRATEYHVRAYAKTAGQGVVYGEDLYFFTLAGIPVLQMVSVTEVTTNSALFQGEIVDSGGEYITQRGFCWGLNPNPTTANHHYDHGMSQTVNDLVPGTTYHVRAYAVNSAGTGYSEEMTFTTLDVPDNPSGTIGGLFSISPTQQIRFSQGNLQYQASTDTWRFAEHQWEALGDENTNISPTYDGWIDLFGWGTSNHDHGAVCYQPWSTAVQAEKYYAYGDSIYNLEDQTGQADWGCNVILNGTENTGRWRTLTSDEWHYLINSRHPGNFPYPKYYCMAVVNGVKGLILLPDDWSSEIYPFVGAGDSNTDFASNLIDGEQWMVLESYGAVFLPATGMRSNHGMNNIGSYGVYWSSTAIDAQHAYHLLFLRAAMNSHLAIRRNFGVAVRLVCDIPPITP